MKFLFGMIGLLFFSTTASADMAVDTALKLYDAANPAEKSVLAASLQNIETGMKWANVALENQRKQQPLFCPPPSLELTGEQLVTIIRHERENTPEAGKYSVGMIMLIALERVFPCQ